MNCPRCGSSNLWDDNLWWGCDDCGYAGNESGETMIFAEDRPGLPRTVEEVERRKRERIHAARAAKGADHD
jgi:hypothetical protein